jgi:hypothetical protein
MRTFFAFVVLGFPLLVAACDLAHTQDAPPVISTPAPQHADSCHDDIPDCAAACGLRETGRREFIDFYERRCAAVILGKNPDRVELQATPYTTSSTTAAGGQEFPPDVRASLMVPQQPTTFDPSAVTRMGGGEPPECKASRLLRAQRRDREADMMSALCIAKGGDAGP